MSDIFDMMESDASNAAATTIETRGLGTVSAMARHIREKEAALALLEQQAKDMKQELLKLTDQDLPTVMQELGLNSFTLDDGSKVEVKPTYGGHIKAENKDAAFEWLRQNGHGDIIKNIVSVTFGAGEDSTALEFYEEAQKLGHQPEQKQDVHASTLKAWIKERVEAGEEFPTVLFGAFIGQRATIKSAKGK